MSKRNNIRWEHVALGVMTASSITATGLLVTQWKHAMVGKKLTNTVLDFLQQHGAIIKGKKIHGGPVSVEMDIDDAVIGTVDAILRDIAQRNAKTSPPTGTVQQQTPTLPPTVAAPQQPASPPQPSSNVFPEPPISGKTGQVVSDQFSNPRANPPTEDFSYAPYTPEGRGPPSIGVV